MRRAAAAVFAVVAATTLAAAGAASGAAPVRVATALTPRWLFFADFVTAHVDVTFDPRAVKADSLRLETPLTPWEIVGPTHVTTSEGASVARRSWRFVVACLSIDCLPRGTAAQRFHLPPVRVVGTTSGGARLSLRRGWPQLRIAGRFLPATTTGLRPVFRLDTALPAATYRTGPSTLALVLTVIGALILALGAAAGGLEVWRWRASRRIVPTAPPLERALELLREAQARETDDRRRAANLLARTLRPETDGLTSKAAAVAWSSRQPDADELEELARDVESRLERPE